MCSTLEIFNIKLTDNKQDLNNNKNKHLNYEKKFVCYFCQKKFNIKSNFNFHMKTHYNEKKIYFCEHSNCLKQFTKKKNLEIHNNLYHFDDNLNKKLIKIINNIMDDYNPIIVSEFNNYKLSKFNLFK